MRWWETHHTSVRYDVRDDWSYYTVLSDVGEARNDEGEALADIDMQREHIDLGKSVVRACMRVEDNRHMRT